MAYFKQDTSSRRWVRKERNMRHYFIFVILLFLSGCAGTPYSVGVDAISAVDNYVMENKRYYFFPLNKDVNIDDLQFKEVCRLLKPYFENKNMIVTENLYNADYIVMIDYGISEPKEHIETYNTPVTGITGYDSYTYGNSNSALDRNNIYGTYNSQTYSTPRYGIVGYQQNVRTYTDYERHIGMAAYGLNKENEDIKLGNQVWKVFIHSIGSSGDFRSVLPIMLNVLPETLGKNTYGAVYYDIYNHNSPGEPLLDDKISVIKR